jgi:hypothetical protein
MPSLADDTDLRDSLGQISIWRRAPPQARLALPRVGYGFIYQAPVARVKVELRDSEGNVKVNTLQNHFWDNEPVILILPTKDLQGGDKKYVGGNSLNSGAQTLQASDSVQRPRHCTRYYRHRQRHLVQYSQAASEVASLHDAELGYIRLADSSWREG